MAKLIAALCSVATAASLLGCAATFRAETYTISDRPPTVTSTYRVLLDVGQASDLEATRLASRIADQLTRAGFRRAEDSPRQADLTVRFELYEDGPAGSQRGPDAGLGASRGTTVASSSSTVGGVPVPLTRRSTVYQHHDYQAAGASSSVEIVRRYRLELSFADAEGPSHKVTATTTTAAGELRDLAPCLIAAAFEDFPHADRRQSEVRIKVRECRAG